MSHLGIQPGTETANDKAEKGSVFFGPAVANVSQNRWKASTAFAVMLMVSGSAMPIAAAPGVESEEPTAILQAEPDVSPESRGRVALTGDWGGRRPVLADAGVAAGGIYTLDFGQVVSGGFRRRSATRGLLDIGLALDLETLAGVRGAIFYAGLQSFRGRNGSDDLGDIQGYSNIDAERFDAFAEVWYEQRLAQNRVRLKIGSVDANTEFAFVEAAEQFINSSAGFSPTIFSLPTYPDPAPGLNVFYHPAENVRLGAGVYESPLRDDDLNRDTDALFSIGEVGVSWPGSRRWAGGKLVLGTWQDSGRVARFDGGVESGTGGYYVVAEQVLRTGFRATSPLVSLFAQFGHADRQVSEIARHGSLGFVSTVPAIRRSGDLFGALVSLVDLGDAGGTGFDTNETVLEMFYRFRVTPYLRIQPDLQYVARPSGGSEAVRGVVASLRLEIAL
jgi:carbohydrate-selective porin OprB